MRQDDYDPYERFSAEQLILRDHLAADRTVLANERTLLAYARTALALLVGGITLVRFFETEITSILGWILIPLGVLTMVIGTRAYLRMRKRIRLLESGVPNHAPQEEGEQP